MTGLFGGVLVLLGLAVAVRQRRARVRHVRGLAKPRSSVRGVRWRRWLRQGWRRRGHRDPDPMTELIAILDGLRTALDAGLPAHRAVTVVLLDHGPPVWAEELLTAARCGAPLGPVWRASLPQVEVASTIGQAWTLSERTGSPLALAVGTAAELLRAEQRLARRRDATTAGARVTMNLLTALPVLGTVGLVALGLDLAQVYGNPLGLGSVLLGVVLLLLGRFVVARMIAAATRGQPA